MVLLTMTSTIVEALEKIHAIDKTSQLEKSNALDALSSNDVTDGTSLADDKGDLENLQTVYKDVKPVNKKSQEPLLSQPVVGNPISHGQIIDLWTDMKSRHIPPYSLDTLLRGARIYVAPPEPRPEPTTEYKALMARLRREEEERSYDRMTNPPPPMETFLQRFPASSAAHAFSSNRYPPTENDPFAETDEVTYADVDRQMALIFNVLVSIIACAGGIWVVARWWSTPARLALSMSGSILVGIAEVVIYSGYVRRVGESKGKEKAKKEVREVVKTWVLGGKLNISSKSQETFRKRKP